MEQQKQSVEKLFGDAVELEGEARRAYLDGACRHAPTVRELVEELLREHARAGSFLEKPILAGSPSAALTAYGAQPGSAIDTPGSTQGPGRFTPGETIAGRFLVVRFIARGGMGEVYEVEDALLPGSRVALKTILPEIAADADACYRFQQEVLLARRINHLNLCPIYEIFRCEEPSPAFLFLTMKLLHGETLEWTLSRNLLLPREDALAVFRQMVSGIAAMHAAGIIHRDIKPTNVMLDRSGSRLCVSIMDFGLARLNESHSVVLKPNVLAGTPGYLAPELIKGQLPSQASDIFALGVLLHQVLTGERPNVSADGFSLSPAPALNVAAVPSTYIHAVRDFLSENPVVRCRAFERIQSVVEEGAPSQSALNETPPKWTRRQMLIASGAACCAAVGGTAWKYDRISEVFHPLPAKRFVALVGWPPSADGATKPMLLGLIDAIANELARAEVYDHNLFLIPHFSSADVSTPAQLNEIRESLGANLVLGTSVLRTAKAFHASLQVLTSPSARALRIRDIHVPIDQQTSLPQRTVRAAAELLGISRYNPNDQRLDAGTTNPEAFAAFQAAEALQKQANDAGLEPAIDKYKEAIDLDRHYSLAVANLAVAYCRLAFLKHDPAAIALARANAEAALAHNPRLVPAHMALAFAFRQTGDEQAATREMQRALALDPANTQTMIWQAQIYTRLNRWQDAEDCYHRALRERPNYWLAHNELGVVLNAQGKYSQAESEFRASSLANPKFALAMSNIGAVCLQLGRVPEATAKLQQSLVLQPNALASSNLSAALRSQGRLVAALGYARKATELDPEDSTTWLELGDCSSLVRGHEGEAKRAYRKAARVQRAQLDVDATDGPGWVLLALYEAKAGAREEAGAHLQKADSLPSRDVDSQMCKARVLEVLGRREEALAVLAECFRRGATPFQIELAPEMAGLRKDTRYQELLHRS